MVKTFFSPSKVIFSTTTKCTHSQQAVSDLYGNNNSTGDCSCATYIV